MEHERIYDYLAINDVLLQLICDQSDKICEMAAVMERAAETDDKGALDEQELVSKLSTENKVSIYFNNHENNISASVVNYSYI